MNPPLHTPGPWKMTLLDGKWSIWGLSSVVCQTQTCLPRIDDRPGAPTDIKTAMYNAHLIAAAPDLLEALKYVDANSSDDSVEKWKMISAAIAKAEGRGQ